MSESLVVSTRSGASFPVPFDPQKHSKPETQAQFIFGNGVKQELEDGGWIMHPAREIVSVQLWRLPGQG